MDTNTRAPKLFGDFGEGLVSYALIRQGFEVACVDHVGADLIAQKDKYRIAVSVKARRYREKSVETKGLVIESPHLEKLRYFADRFGLDPVFAFAVCLEDEKEIHLFMLRVADVEKFLDKVQHGYRLRFSEKYFKETSRAHYMNYSCWKEQEIGSWPNLR